LRADAGDLARVYVIGDRLMATDVLFVANGFAQPHEAGQLIKNMIQWAKRSPACIEVRCGATAVIEDPERTARLFERSGMKPYGTSTEWNLKGQRHVRRSRALSARFSAAL
jgi:hypothetical protein